MTDGSGKGHITKRQAFWGLVVLLVPASFCTLLVWLFLPGWWQLSAYFWYSIPGNSFILLPHEPAVIYAGTLYDPALVAIVGGIATIPASALDHQLFTRAFQFKPLAQVKETRLSRWTAGPSRFNPGGRYSFSPSVQSRFTRSESPLPCTAIPWAGTSLPYSPGESRVTTSSHGAASRRPGI